MQEHTFQAPKHYVGPRAILPPALRRKPLTAKGYMTVKEGLHRQNQRDNAAKLPVITSDDTNIKLTIAPTWSLRIG